MRWMATLGVTQMVMAAMAPAMAEDEAPAPSFEAHVPMRAITHGPKSHWFGYYDKLQFSMDDRYVLGMEVGFDDRSPAPDDRIVLGMVDLEQGDAWRPFAETTAWCWQQGCMLQWLPGSKTEVIYNVRQDGHYAAVIQDVFSGAKRALPKPVYAVSPDGTRALGVNFARVGQTRPGYGYNGIADPGAGDKHPADDGLYVMDLATGESRTLFTLDAMAGYGALPELGGKHWFNHLLFNTDGSRFIFLHRAHRRPDGKHGWFTRMLTAAPDGSGLHVVSDHDMVSHFIWKNPRQILAWARQPEDGDHFYLFTDQQDGYEVIGDGALTRDGHCTYSPDGEWVLTDTYPQKDRMQHLMLYRPSDGKLVELGAFFLPRSQHGEVRCDLHARWSRSGRWICIDSMHEGGQRQMYVLEVGGALAGDS